MSGKPSILVHHDDSKPRQTIGRHTVSFSDDFDPRAPDSGDNSRHSIRGDSPPRLVDESSGASSRRNATSEPPVLLDDDDAPRLTRRNTLSLPTSSRAPTSPPSAWHPAGTVYRFIILSTVAFILTTGYFSDETIGATNSELRTYESLADGAR